MERFEGTVKFVKDFTFETPSYMSRRYYGYSYDLMHIYKFEDSDKNVYIWKTTGILAKEDKVPAKNDPESFYIETTSIPVGSTIKIKASIKGENEYKGEHQTLLTRVKVEDIIIKALTKEERDEILKEEQLDSLEDGDFIWEMPYKQYKQHYSDCETIIGSFVSSEYGGPSLISVIIREGRLKNSGVRFQKFDTYRFVNEDRTKVRCLYAVSEENARKRLEKEYPDIDWIFDGTTYRR